MILLWGLPRERPMEIVAAELALRGARCCFIDQSAVLETSLELRVDHEVRGNLRVGAAAARLEEVRAVYFRCHDTRRLPSVAAAGADSEPWRHALAVDDGLLAWLDLTPALVVNRPVAMASNNAKPHQLALIARQGFATPATLVTTDPCEAEAFWDRCGTVIYKSTSGVRSRVSRLRPEERARLHDVVSCPTQFQAHVPGVDHRVHVVGDRAFGARVLSQADDYRFARADCGEVDIEPFELDAELTDRCVALARALGLAFAGIDLRRAPDGEWYCFEVNPSPAFSVYEDATGHAIGAALASLLEGGAR